MCAYECLLLLDDKLDVGVGSTLSHANMRATLLSTFQWANADSKYFEAPPPIVVLVMLRPGG